MSRWFALCPFFQTEKRLSISCEDTVRQFYTKKDKQQQLRKHCESDWQKCPHAIALNDLYERMDNMKTQKDRDVAALEHLAAARKKENEELRQRLGYMNARLQSLEMMLGYLCDKHNETEISTADMARFFGQYEVNWKTSGKEKILIEKVKRSAR